MAIVLPQSEFTWLKKEGRHWKVGDRHSRALLRKVEKRHSQLEKSIFREYLRIADSGNYHKADAWLEDILRRLHISDEYCGLNAESAFHSFKSFADLISKRLEKEFHDFARRTTVRIAFDRVKQAVEACGLTFPVTETDAKERNQAANERAAAGLMRVFDPVWWRRQLRTQAFRNSESVYRELGLVSKTKAIYISEPNFRRYLALQNENESLLDNLVAENQFGYSATLSELKSASVSNPKNRRNELMTRIGGFEDLATGLGHSAVFYTITCPSKFHAVHQSGHRNAKFEGATPRQSNDYLNKVWSRVRAAWNRAGITCYGIRTVEPHHDGTPHWHLLLFMPQEQLQEATKIFETYALQEDGNEPGAIENRFRTEIIDPEKGRATGYVAKYVSKCIDGYQVGEDSYGKDAIESAARIRAWSSIWGIRQFQFIGSPSVTVYRELRRLRNIEGLRTGLLQELEQAADKGDWTRFVDLMGGPNVKRADQPLRAMMIPKAEPNRYEEQQSKLIGLLGFAGNVVTRISEWKVRPKRRHCDDQEQKPIAVASGRGANAPPWSSVNNCTVPVSN